MSVSQHVKLPIYLCLNNKERVCPHEKVKCYLFLEKVFKLGFILCKQSSFKHRKNKINNRFKEQWKGSMVLMWDSFINKGMYK